MKILHVIPSLSPELGGPHWVAMNLVWALRELGIDAEIVTTDYGVSVPTSKRIDYCFEGALSVPVWFLPYDRPPLKEFIFSRAATAWLWQNVANYDLLDNHYLFSYLPTCAAAIARWKKVPYTVRTMGQLAPWALSQSERKKQIYTTLIERRNLTRAAAIHCTTVAEAEDIRHFGLKTPTVTLPLGVPLPVEIPDASAQLRDRYRIDSDCPVVLFLSRIHYKKQPDLLLRSLKRIKEQGQPFHALIAGSGEDDYLDALKLLANALGIGDQVTFCGFVSGRDKDLLFQGADMFVLPSHSENFGIAVAEALAAKLPVVITPEVQIAPDIDRAEAGLVVEGEVEAFTGAIARLLASPELRGQMGQRGAYLAKTCYSWESIAKQLVLAYDVSSRRQSP
ncbi:MAG: glycosyltransferase [Cyanobacteria bacterium J06614_10]